MLNILILFFFLFCFAFFALFVFFLGGGNIETSSECLNKYCFIFGILFK